MSVGIVFAIILGWIISTGYRLGKKYGPLQDDLAARLRFMDYNSRTLSPEHEWHNIMHKLKCDAAEREYEFELKWARIDQQVAVYKYMKDKIDAMPPEEKLEWIPKWIEYGIDHRDEELNYCVSYLDYFIAMEVCPIAGIFMPVVFKKPTGGIIYTV